jgi:hypothetical protein
MSLSQKKGCVATKNTMDNISDSHSAYKTQSVQYIYAISVTKLRSWDWGNKIDWNATR